LPRGRSCNQVRRGDHRESFQTFDPGADAFANDMQLYGMLAETKVRGRFPSRRRLFTYADYALMYRKDDPEFANGSSAFKRPAGSRVIVAIYERWFEPRCFGRATNLPMSPHRKKSSGADSWKGEARRGEPAKQASLYH
jgi:hypothetical protein